VEKIKGILFQPPLRIDYLSNYRRIKLRLKLFLLWLVKNKVDQIFILNDIVGVNKLNTFFGRNLKFVILPDPLCEINPNVLLSKKLNEDDFLDILIFGSINKRKGVLSLLDALSGINEKKLLRPIRLTIAGKQGVELVPYISSRVRDINSSEFNVIIEVRNEYLSKDEITNLISKSSLLWLGYEDFVWSSGVLGHAIVHSVPVITFPGGLIAELVSSGNFGYVIDGGKEALSCFFKNLANREVQAIKVDNLMRSEYLEMNSEVNFLAKLIND
jgi:glycosyltransferase involved in cell wall biosynthesis